MEQCNPFRFVVFPLSKRILTANPGLGNQRGDVRDLATRGVERLNLQAVPREKLGKGDKKMARKATGRKTMATKTSQTKTLTTKTTKEKTRGCRG